MKKYMLLSLCMLCYSCMLNFELGNKENTSYSQKNEVKLPNDIRWVTNSSEYQILCEQTYENAWNHLSETLTIADSQSAIIMDLDETVLDNSDYQVGLTEKNESYNPESWSVWVNLEKALDDPYGDDNIFMHSRDEIIIFSRYENRAETLTPFVCLLYTSPSPRDRG